MRFLIIVTGWNWENYIIPCFESIHRQTYTNWKVSVIDDGSTDDSYQVLQNYHSKRFQINFFDKNKGTYYARDQAIKNSSDYDVIVLLDGDDELLPNALELAVKEYEKGNLMTYGNYVDSNNEICKIDINYPEEIHLNRDYRKDLFRCTHLRTFKKELYEAIPKWSLTQAEKDSYPDCEILFSMLEMSGKERIGVIQEPIYIYSNTNPMRTLKRFGKDYEGYDVIVNRPKRELL